MDRDPRKSRHTKRTVTRGLLNKNLKDKKPDSWRSRKVNTQASSRIWRLSYFSAKDRCAVGKIF